MKITALVNKDCHGQGQRSLKKQATLTRAVRAAVRAFGADHVNVALALLNLGDFFQQQNRFDQAESTYERAADIYERLGLGHELLLAIAIRSWANALFDQGQTEKAESLRLQARLLMINNQ